jgi:hypothetical protein
MHLTFMAYATMASAAHYVLIIGRMHTLRKPAKEAMPLLNQGYEHGFVEQNI